MHREDELDALLTDQAQGRPRHGSVSRDIEPLLAAAAQLDVLRDAMPSSAFATQLEERLMAHMAQTPSTAATHSHQTAARRRAPLRLPSRVTWAAIAATLLLTIGLGALTAKAAPGAPLYVVRQFAQTLAAQALSSPTADPLAALAQTRVDLANYDAAVASGNAPAALAALSKLRADDARVAQSISTVSASSARQQAQAQLNDFRRSAVTDLRASLSIFDWQGRAQVTNALRAWGDASLTVTQVMILPDSSNSKNTQPSTSSASRLIEARGAGFVTGAHVLVNGQPSGVIVSLSPTQMTVRVDASVVGSGDSHALVIGVENPDGTVALTTRIEQDDHSGPSPAETPGGGDHGGHGGATGSGSDATPTGAPTSTGTPSPEETPTSTKTPTS